MRNLQRKRTIAVCMLLVMCIVMFPIKINAAGKISDACAKAYAKKINSLHKKNYSNYPSNLETRDEIVISDMNGDNVPELMYYEIRNTMGQPLEVYTYRKGKVLKMGKINAGEIYKISGSKTKYKYHGMFGVGCNEYGILSFGKSKIKKQNLAWTNTSYL